MEIDENKMKMLDGKIKGFDYEEKLPKWIKHKFYKSDLSDEKLNQLYEIGKKIKDDPIPLFENLYKNGEACILVQTLSRSVKNSKLNEITNGESNAKLEKTTPNTIISNTRIKHIRLRCHPNNKEFFEKKKTTSTTSTTSKDVYKYKTLFINKDLDKIINRIKKIKEIDNDDVMIQQIRFNIKDKKQYQEKNIYIISY